MSLDMKKIDCYKLLTGEEYVLLALYHHFSKKKLKVNVFSDNVILYEDLIDSYNECIENSHEKEKFLKYIAYLNWDTFKKDVELYNEKPWKYSKPVIWDDRLKESYYIQQLTRSHRFELYIDNMFKEQGVDIGVFYDKDSQYSGESRAGIEIKYDDKSLKTPNLYIEYQERLNEGEPWVDSGILKNDNTIYWAIGNYEFVYFIAKKDLVNILNGDLDIQIRHVAAKTGTSKGFLLNKNDAKKISNPIDVVVLNINNFDSL
jgi:hypothetical protein